MTSRPDEVRAGEHSPVRGRPGGAQIIPRPDVWHIGGPAPWIAQADAALGTTELLTAIGQRSGRPVLQPFPDARDSAVLVVLHDGPDGPETLFTKRSMRLRNHRGEISFPGGRLEPGETPVHAALRESWEEVGLDPDGVTVHGELDHLATVVSRSHIVPIVASVAERPVLLAAEEEVDRIMWVSLAELARPDTFREEIWGEPPLDRPIFFFELDDETIWGATGRMLHQLLRLAHGIDEPEPLAW
jgi:8-oxo-dGTP pyrophosphatase MutT (NUDIX family)